MSKSPRNGGFIINNFRYNFYTYYLCFLLKNALSYVFLDLDIYFYNLFEPGDLGGQEQCRENLL